MGRSGGAVDARAHVPPQPTGHPWPSGTPRHALPEAPPAEAAPATPRHVLPQPPAVLTRGPGDRRILTTAGLAVVLAAAAAIMAHPLPAWCAAIAIAIRLVGGAQYAVAVARRQACPNLVTWFLWGLTPMIAVAAQAGDRSPEVTVTFVLGLGPLVITAVGLCTDRSASRLTPFTMSCAAASFVGIVLWQLTAQPALAIAFCIVADLLATLPTLQKAYRSPDSEYAPPYLMSVLAMVITLGTVAHGEFTAYGFPLYMLVVNVILFAAAAFPLAWIVSGRETLPRGRRTRRSRHGIPRGHHPAAPLGSVAPTAGRS